MEPVLFHPEELSKYHPEQIRPCHKMEEKERYHDGVLRFEGGPNDDCVWVGSLSFLGFSSFESNFKFKLKAIVGNSTC
jgi:hypothetical protein